MSENIPLYHKQKIIKVIENLDGAFGFKKSDFLKPEASDIETSNIGWWLRLKKYPEYYFFFREIGTEVFIKYMPNPLENKERAMRIDVRKGKTIDYVISQAKKWLLLVDEQTKVQEQWDSLFNERLDSEFTSYDIIEDSTDDEPLTNSEVENIRLFLQEFNQLVQNSKTLPEIVKDETSRITIESEAQLKNNPTRSFIKWLRGVLDKLFVNYLTDPNYRSEVNGYLRNGLEKVNQYYHMAIEWIRQLGG